MATPFSLNTYFKFTEVVSVLLFKYGSSVWIEYWKAIPASFRVSLPAKFSTIQSKLLNATHIACFKLGLILMGVQPPLSFELKVNFVSNSSVCPNSLKPQQPFWNLINFSLLHLTLVVLMGFFSDDAANTMSSNTNYFRSCLDSWWSSACILFGPYVRWCKNLLKFSGTSTLPCNISICFLMFW